VVKGPLSFKDVGGGGFCKNIAFAKVKRMKTENQGRREDERLAWVDLWVMRTT